jgi:A/G-specific adenine glycosylase
MHHPLFQSLIDWSLTYYHSLPWRINRTLYTTLVSEMMLQQTTVATVDKKFQAFLLLFPEWADLARAHQDQVMSAWRGLGYYQRARRLHQLAQIAQSEDHFKSLLSGDKKLPGIGLYTKSALLSIGLNQPALAIDANIRRVLSRYVGKESTDQELWAFYEKHLKEYTQPRELNEALMDLGRVVCTAKKALCAHCPLQRGCVSQGVLSDVKTQLKEKKDITLVRLLVVKDNKILGYKKPQGYWLEGYLELPTFIIDDFDFHQYVGMNKDHLGCSPTFTIKSTITHHRVVNQIYHLEDLGVVKDLLDDFTALDYYPLDALWANTSMKMIRRMRWETQIS